MTGRGPRSGRGGTSRAAPELGGGRSGVPGAWGQATPQQGLCGSGGDAGTVAGAVVPITAASRLSRAAGAHPAWERGSGGAGGLHRSSPGLCWVRTSLGPDALCLGWRLRAAAAGRGWGLGDSAGGAAPAPGLCLREQSAMAWGQGRGAVPRGDTDAPTLHRPSHPRGLDVGSRNREGTGMGTGAGRCRRLCCRVCVWGGVSPSPRPRVPGPVVHPSARQDSPSWPPEPGRAQPGHRGVPAQSQ